MNSVDNAIPPVTDTADFAFQVSLLRLNLHLAEAEEDAAPQRRAHTEAVAHIEALGERR